MSEEEREVVVEKGAEGSERFPELLRAIGELDEDARGVARDVEMWTRRIRGGEKAYAFVETAPEESGAPAGSVSTRQWYYGVGAERMGPVGEGELRALLLNRRLSRTTPVWTKGQEGWISAEEAGLVTEEEEEEKDCPACGVANRPTAKFCRSCGHSMKKEAEEASNAVPECHSCGAEVSPGAKFCRACGARLG